MTDPPPGSKPRIAESFEDADPGSLVYVDRRGQVQSARHQRQLNAISLTGYGALLLALNGLYWVMGGPIGLAIGGAATALLLRHLPSVFRLRRAVALLVAERLDESELLLERVRRGWNPPGIKAQAEHHLSRIATLRGQHEQALALLESALRIAGDDRALGAPRRMMEYGRMVALVNLGRAQGARERFDLLPRTLEGDLLRAQRAIADLYIALGEGNHDYDPTYLHEQAEIAASLPSARTLLALVAWAERHAGRHARAAELLRLADSRPGESLVRRMFPRLADWMDAQRR